VLNISFYYHSKDFVKGQPMGSEEKGDFKKLIRNFLVELVVYGVLLVIYFLVALRYLANPLMQLFQNSLTLYGFVSLGLMVVQAVVLEMVVSYLFDFLGLHRLNK
jgi:hypothetical protein